MGRREADDIGDLLRRWADSRAPAASEQLARFMGPRSAVQEVPGRAIWRKVAGAGLGVKMIVAVGLITATAAAAAVGAEHLGPSRAPEAPAAPFSITVSTPGSGSTDDRPSGTATLTDHGATSSDRAIASESPGPTSPTDGESADAGSTPDATEGDTTAPDESSPASVSADESGGEVTTEAAQAPAPTDSANSSGSIGAAQN